METLSVESQNLEFGLNYSELQYLIPVFIQWAVVITVPPNKYFKKNKELFKVKRKFFEICHDEYEKFDICLLIIKMFDLITKCT